MLLRGLFRHQQEHHQPDGFAVRRVKGDRRRQAHEGGHRLVQALDATVGHGNAMAKAGRAQPLTREQAVENRCAGDTVIVFEQQASLFENAFLAGRFQVQKDVGRRQDP